MSFNFETIKEKDDHIPHFDNVESKDQSADYSTAFKFIVLPPWVEDAVTRNNKSREIVINSSELSNILCMSDVENYIENDYWMKDILWYNKENDLHLNGVITHFAFGYLPPVEYRPNHSFNADRHLIKTVMYNHFLDPDMVSDNLNSYYVTIKPYCDNIVAVRLHKASPDENVYEKRATAMADWISLARKFVSFESIAKAGVVTAYLSNYAQQLDSASIG